MDVNPLGISGGLAIWWTNEVGIVFNHISKNIIDNEVQMGVGGMKMKVTWIYGDSTGYNWNRLKGIVLHRHEPWIVLWDFNDISNHWEKVGGRRRD